MQWYVDQLLIPGQPSTTLFKVPSTALLNPKTAASLYPQLRRQKLSGVQLVSLHLFLHKPSGNDDSTDPSFGPYISTLPRDFSSHPLQWMVKRDIQLEDPWEFFMLETLPPGVKRKLDTLHQRFWEDWRAVSHVVVWSTFLYTGGRVTFHRLNSPLSGPFPINRM